MENRALRLDRRVWWSVAFLVLLAVVGLWYVKWNPYYHKAIVAATKHAIGGSVVTGQTAAAPAPSFSAAWGYTVTYFKAIWQAMVLGLLLGSGVQVLVPRDWLLRALGTAGFKSTATAAAAAVPGMMCSCCAAPVSVGLRRQGVSAGATLAFWLGNPMLNPATMIFMGFVLGWQWVGLRAAMALLLVLGVSLWADRMMQTEQLSPAVASEVATAAQPGPAPGSLLVCWLKTLGQMTLRLIPEYLVVVFALGAARSWLFPAMNPAIGQSLWLVVVLAVSGMLFVIPTAGEIPIVQVLRSYGLGSAGAGALLTTLPPLSLPSLLMMSKVLPRRVLVFVAGAVVVLGLLSALIAGVLGF